MNYMKNYMLVCQTKTFELHKIKIDTINET